MPWSASLFDLREPAHVLPAAALGGLLMPLFVALFVARLFGELHGGLSK